MSLIQIGLSKCTLVLKSTDLLSRFAHESGLYCFTQSLELEGNWSLALIQLFPVHHFLFVGFSLTVEWGQALLPQIAVCEGKETAGMGFHLLVLTICELEGSPAYCCIALQRLSCCSGAVQTAGNGSLGLALQSPASPLHTRGKGCCSAILFCPRVSSTHARGLCGVDGGLAYWPTVWCAETGEVMLEFKAAVTHNQNRGGEFECFKCELYQKLNLHRGWNVCACFSFILCLLLSVT